jgi:hypothetical protein
MLRKPSEDCAEGWSDTRDRCCDSKLPPLIEACELLELSTEEEGDEVDEDDS